MAAGLEEDASLQWELVQVVRRTNAINQFYLCLIAPINKLFVQENIQQTEKVNIFQGKCTSLYKYLNL